MTVVSTSTTATKALTGADYLLVTSSGSIVIDGTTSDGVDATGSSNSIAIDGLVYSVDGGSGVGVYIANGGSTNLLVNGQVQGDRGVYADGASAVSISVGSQGSIDSTTYQAVFFEGNFTDPAATGDSLNNAGDISASLSNTGGGVGAAFGGGDTIINSGQISGSLGVDFSQEVATETVENSGTVEGVSAAIFCQDSSAGDDIVNSGVITDGVANAIGSTDAVLYFDDNSGTTSTIDNTGAISGSGYVIQSISDILDIANSGTVHGGLYSKANVDVDNAGLWKGQAGSAVVVFDLTHNDDALINSHAGTIGGAWKALEWGLISLCSDIDASTARSPSPEQARPTA